MIKYYFLFSFFFFPIFLTGQTCCSGGVPVSGNLGLPASQKGTLQFNLSYDFNNLNTLKSGTTVLDDKSRNRTTHSILLETGYSFSNRFSLDAFFSFVKQERLINDVDFTSTQGIGDMIILAKYQLIKSEKNNLLIGGGIKIPIGASDRKNKIGIPLNADLQPGSGAFDFIGWGQWTRPLEVRPSFQFSSILIYSYKGKNNSYLGNSLYQFGQEISWSLGIADQFLLAKKIMNPSIQVRYRNAQPDLFEKGILPSTGGNWIFLKPGISMLWTPQVSVETNVELPLLANIEGTQVTPTIRWTIGFFYKINVLKKKRNDFPEFNLN